MTLEEIRAAIRHFESLQKRYTTQHNGRQCAFCDIALAALRELMDAERDGRAVVLPCKVGSDVYRVVNDAEPHVTKDTVRQISINEHGRFLVLTGDRLLYLSDFGKTVFLTRAAAEQAKGERE